MQDLLKPQCLSSSSLISLFFFKKKNWGRLTLLTKNKKSLQPRPISRKYFQDIDIYLAKIFRWGFCVFISTHVSKSLLALPSYITSPFRGQHSSPEGNRVPCSQLSNLPGTRQRTLNRDETVGKNKTIHVSRKSVSILTVTAVAVTGRNKFLNVNRLMCPCPAATQTALAILLGKWINDGLSQFESPKV